MSKASDLIYEYVRAGVKFEEAHQALKDMAEKKESLLQEIVDCGPLKAALMTTGVTVSNKLCRIHDTDPESLRGEWEMTVYDEPISAYSLSLYDEPEVMESCDE